MQELAEVRLTAWVHGYVQGVGFRWWTRSRALELGLTGYASNKPDGRVQVVAQGPRDACQRLLDLLQSGNTPGTSTKSSPTGQKWATRSRASPSDSLRGCSVARRAPQESDAEGLQVLCFADDSALRAGHHLRRRTQRLRQVQRGRRAHLGDGRAGRQDTARRQDGGRHLRRHVVAAAAGSRRGHRDHRQLRQLAADRVLRGVDHPPDVPRRRQRVRNQRQQLPFDGCAGTAERLRHRPRDARHRRPGQALRDPGVRPGGPAGVHRGSRGRAQAPQAQGEGGPQARRDVGQPRPADGPDHRAAPPAQAARQAGRDGPSGPDHPGRSARRAAPAGRRRPRHPQRRIRQHQPGRDDAAPRARRDDRPAGGRHRRTRTPTSRRSPD